MKFNKFALLLCLVLICLFALRTFRSINFHASFSPHSAAIIACDRAEILLRATDGIGLLYSGSLSLQGKTNQTNNKQKAKSEVTSKSVLSNRDSFIDGAKNLLGEACKYAPDDQIILARQIIFKAETDEDISTDLSHLNLISQDSGHKQVSLPAKQLAEVMQTIYGMNESRSEVAPYSPARARDIADEIRQNLEKTLSDGWYRERALLHTYELLDQRKNYQSTLVMIENRARTFFIRLATLGLAALICGLIGFGVILWQLRRLAMGPFKSGIQSRISVGSVKYGWRSVIAVFVAWVFTQIFIGLISSSLRKQFLGTALASSNSSATAALIATIYVLCNAPSLLYIYFFCLKPHGIALIEGINLKLKGGRELLTFLEQGY